MSKWIYGVVPLALSCFVTAAGRSQAIDFLAASPVKERARIVADVEAFRIHMLKAPISTKPIKGRRPMFAIRTGGLTAWCEGRCCGCFTSGESRTSGEISRSP